MQHPRPQEDFRGTQLVLAWHDSTRYNTPVLKQMGRHVFVLLVVPGIVADVGDGMVVFPKHIFENLKKEKKEKTRPMQCSQFQLVSRCRENSEQ